MFNRCIDKVLTCKGFNTLALTVMNTAVINNLYFLIFPWFMSASPLQPCALLFSDMALRVSA